jgi:hypothetical protein
MYVKLNYVNDMTNDMIFDVQYTLVASFTIDWISISTQLYWRLVIVMIPKQKIVKKSKFVSIFDVITFLLSVFKIDFNFG